MKMAKADKDDLNTAMDLAKMIESLSDRHFPTLTLGDSEEHFNEDNDSQCGKALRELLKIAERGSLFRVVLGAAVMLDPRNKLVDPDADTIEHHPERKDSERFRWLMDSENLAHAGRQVAVIRSLQKLSYADAIKLIDSEMASTSTGETPR